MRHESKLPRRTVLKVAVAGALLPALPATVFAAPMATRRIPGSGESLPVIGLGTSDEFERMPDDGGAALKAVLKTLVEKGGTLIDTAPGYGDAEQVLGRLLDDLGLLDEVFLSSKVRTRGRNEGRQSLERSARRLGKEPLDLMMVHSLVDADTQLDNLERWKDEGRVRYIGITTSRSSGFEQMESLIRSRELDFIQVNYSALEPEAALRVIPAARDRGVAVMINRAFMNGRYFSLVRGRELPDWAAGFDCESWAQLALKYILGHPDVTCVLAATSNPRHMADNAGAGYGRLPDDGDRTRIERLLAEL